MTLYYGRYVSGGSFLHPSVLTVFVVKLIHIKKHQAAEAYPDYDSYIRVHTGDIHYAKQH